MEPSTPAKFALGLIQAGLGFGALVLGISMPEHSGKVAAIWLVLAYLLHTTPNRQPSMLNCLNFCLNWVLVRA